MYIAMAFTIVVCILEILGVFKEAGMGLALVGIVVTLGFGIQASTRKNVLRMEKILEGHTAILQSHTAMLREIITVLKEVRDLLKKE